jgi:hypothetical protein
VRGMVTNKDTAEIVAGVMNLSKQLGLRVVAEGVEDEDQCDHLRALNCHAGQGHLFAKPLDLEGAVEVLKTGLAPRPERRRETMAVPEGAPTVPRLFVRGRRLVTRRVASFAAAVLILLSAGVFAVVNSGEPSSGRVTPAADLKQQSIETTAPAPSAPTITTKQIAERPAAPSAPPVTTEKVARITSSPPVASSPPPAAPSTAVAHTLPLDVVHLHRFGDCRGQLDVSRDGVAFLSQHDSDTFTLKFAEFLHALSDDTLTLKSATKTYRFKASASGSDGTRQLREFADRIARARR